MDRIADLMTEAPFTVQPTDVVGPTRDAMLDSGVHCLPVVDDRDHAVGIVSSWDLVEEYAPQESIQNAMTTRVLRVGAHQDASEAAATMCTNFVHHLVVVDDEDRVVGVLSSLDLLSALVDA